MSVLDRLHAGTAPLPDQFFATGMVLAAADADLTISVSDLRALGRTLIDAAREMRRDRASVRALTDELLEEQAIAVRGDADVIAHPAMMGGQR